MIGMMPQNKKIASLIIGGSRPSEDVQGPEVEENDDVAMDSVASKIMSAFEAKDKKALISGLKDFMMLMESSEDEME